MSSEWRLVTFPVIAESRMGDGMMGNKKEMGRGGSGVWVSARMGCGSNGWGSRMWKYP